MRLTMVGGRISRSLAPPAFRGYLGFPRDVEIGAQQLFDLDIDSESEADRA